jgi:hypothetical protein
MFYLHARMASDLALLAALCLTTTLTCWLLRHLGPATPRRPRKQYTVGPRTVAAHC